MATVLFDDDECAVLANFEIRAVLCKYVLVYWCLGVLVSSQGLHGILRKYGRDAHRCANTRVRPKSESRRVSRVESNNFLK
jgi:hypothetical protein